MVKTTIITNTIIIVKQKTNQNTKTRTNPQKTNKHNLKTNKRNNKTNSSSSNSSPKPWA